MTSIGMRPWLDRLLGESQANVAPLTNEAERTREETIATRSLLDVRLRARRVVDRNPGITQPNRPFDLVEMLYWGRAWQWGYWKHPPLPAWIAQSVYQISGSAIWPTYLAGQLAMAVMFWAVWKLSREFLRPWPAVCAVPAAGGLPLLQPGHRRLEQHDGVVSVLGPLRMESVPSARD